MRNAVKQLRHHWTAIAWVMLGLFLPAGAPAAIIVHTDQPTYGVLPGQSFAIDILIDADGASPGDQFIPGGLFSMGVVLMFNQADASVAHGSDIALPAKLDSNGLGGPADKSVGAGRAGAAGALDLFDPLPYGQPLLATITLTNLATSGSYTLDLDRFYSTKANFLDFGGTLLDPQITFSSATVNVVPEPSIAAIVFAAAVLHIHRRRVGATGRTASASGKTSPMRPRSAARTSPESPPAAGKSEI